MRLNLLTMIEIAWDYCHSYMRQWWNSARENECVWQ